MKMTAKAILLCTWGRDLDFKHSGEKRRFKDLQINENKGHGTKSSEGGKEGKDKDRI